MLPPIKDRLANFAQCRRQVGMTGTEGARSAFAVHEELARLAVRLVDLDLAGVVRDVEQERTDRHSGKKWRKDSPREMAEDLAVSQSAVDCGAHGAEIALADLRIDWRTGKLAIGQRYTRCGSGLQHLAQELGADLMAEPARAAMDGHHDLVAA